HTETEVGSNQAFAVAVRQRAVEQAAGSQRVHTTSGSDHFEAIAETGLGEGPGGQQVECTRRSNARTGARPRPQVHDIRQSAVIPSGGSPEIDVGLAEKARW